jgi:predicted AAA+ superfamily ATPase
LNFDDERLATVSDYDEWIVALQGVYGKPRYLLFDEIQNLPRWELFVNRLQRQGYRVVVTGSNANLLGSELATHLTGRHLAKVLLPFSFGEYLAATAAGPLTDLERAGALDAYAEQGGYPEPLLKRVDRKDYLRTLLQSTLYKDIVKRFRVRAVQGIEDLATVLLSNISREYSYHALTAITRCRSVHTVEKYMRYLREAYLVFTVPRFSFKVREQVGQNKKIYCLDNGMALAAGVRFSPDRGALFENLIAVSLKKRELAGDISLFHWKSPHGEEVDFLVKEGLRVSRLIQVCADLSNPQTLKREMRALLKASAMLECRELILLNDRIDRTETFRWHDLEREVQLIPVWKWLIENR